ncbi:MAG TPA: site-2 protease family protein, partial [Candidatus Sulfotelmatobacter sp.]|nr:site-2 protease family protein [Candidatus Sulfotelmatobacter sp.]
MNIAIGFVLVLGILILVHEWGHFIVARFFGVRVDVFSIGFGPRLFGWKRGATDYRVSAIPLGGYVRMAGQDLSD